MVDLNDKNSEAPRPEKPKRRNFTLWVLVGILAVLTLANLDAILKPINALNDILTPIVIGLVIAYLCNPFLRFFEIKVFYKLKRTVNRALSMLFTYVVVLLIISGVVLLIIPQLIESVNDFRVNGMFYVNRLISSINDFVSTLPFDLPGETENLLTLEKLLTLMMNLLEQFGTGIVGSLGAFAGSALTLLKNILVGVFVSIYVLLSKDRLKAGCCRAIHALFSEKNERSILYYTTQANRKFGGFIVGKMIDSIMVGITAAILFTIFKIPYPILIAVIIGVTDFIPFFGPFIGAIPSAVIIFIAEPSKTILFVILILVVQQIDGNLLAPMILGDHTGLTSLGVLIAITLMGGLFGFIGMLIGVPLFAIIVTMLDDYLKHRLSQKGSPTDLYSYYAADAFIRPSDEAESQHATMTKRFMHWVAAVEEETEAEDYAPGLFRAGINTLRVGLLHVGRFFRRVFSVKQISDDYLGSHVTHILRRGMVSSRTFLRVMILTVLTLGIYPLYLLETVAVNTNISCSRDGRRTWGILPVMVLTVITLGIFPLIWHCQVICRFRHYCEQHDREPVASMKHYLLWTLLGLPIVVGPLIAFARFLRAYNQSCRIFNEVHTFPISPDVLAEEAAEGAAYLAAQRAAKAAEKLSAVGSDTVLFSSLEEKSENDAPMSETDGNTSDATNQP